MVSRLANGWKTHILSEDLFERLFSQIESIEIRKEAQIQVMGITTSKTMIQSAWEGCDEVTETETSMDQVVGMRKQLDGGNNPPRNTSVIA